MPIINYSIIATLHSFLCLVLILPPLLQQKKSLYDASQRLSYLDSVIQETMRIFPPIPTYVLIVHGHTHTHTHTHTVLVLMYCYKYLSEDCFVTVRLTLSWNGARCLKEQTCTYQPSSCTRTPISGHSLTGSNQPGEQPCNQQDSGGTYIDEGWSLASIEYVP